MNDFYLITLDDGIEEGWGPFFLLVCGGGNEGVRAERAWTKATQRRKKEGLLFCLASVLLFSFCIFFLLNECSSVCAICLFGLFFLFFSILPGPLSFVFFLFQRLYSLTSTHISSSCRLLARPPSFFPPSLLLLISLSTSRPWAS